MDDSGNAPAEFPASSWPLSNGDDGKLRAYQYQLDLYQSALQRNTIVVLDTGGGKTFVAIKLIQYYATEEIQRLNNRPATDELGRTPPPRRLALFLVNLVPLVFQQAKAIESQLDLRVGKLYGALGVDSWAAEQWQTVLTKYDVLVMTAQVFLDALRRSYMDLERFNVLVVDECHHTRKGHPYNCIMREFYDRLSPTHRPRILGLTASPLCLQSTIELCAQSLETNLDSQIFTVETGLESRLLNKPKEIKLYYDPVPVTSIPSTALTRAVRETLDGESEVLQDALKEAERIAAELGPWCVDAYWRLLASSSAAKRQELFEGRRMARIERLSSATRAELARLVTLYSLDNQIPDLVAEPGLGSPKVQRLVAALAMFASKAEQLCAIVFVARRLSAYLLCRLIASLPTLAFVRPALLVGRRSSQSPADVTNSLVRMQRTIHDFHTRVCNLLVATQVGEEGLDIRACNVVIRFNLFNTVIEYIQSRGRARHPNSLFVVMVERGNAAQEGIVERFAQAEADMREWCLKASGRETTGRSGPRAGTDHSDFVNDNGDDMDGEAGAMTQRYCVPSTGATVTLASAVSLLFQYCATLPSDDFYLPMPTVAITEELDGFRAHIRLPASAPVHQVTGYTMRSKAKAKRSAAIYACLLLHQAGALTDYLRPVFSMRRRRCGIGGAVKYTVSNPAQAAVVAENDAHLEEFEREEDGLRKDFNVRHEYVTDADRVWRPATTTDTPASNPGSTNGTDTGIGPESETTWYPNVLAMPTTGAGPTYHSWLFLTRVPLPIDLPSLPLDHPLIPQVTVRPYPCDPRGLALTSGQYDLLTNFTLRLFSTLSRRRYVCPVGSPPYLLAPLHTVPPTPPSQGHAPTEPFDLNRWIAHYVPGAELVNLIAHDTVDLALEDYINPDGTARSDPDLVIVDQARANVCLYVDRIRTDLHPFSPIPTEETADVPDTAFSSYLDYYRWHRGLDEAKRELIVEQAASLPLLQIRPTPDRRSYLPAPPREINAADVDGYPEERGKSGAADDEKDKVAAVTSGKTTVGPRHLIPLLCAKHPLSARTHRSALLLPTVLYSLEGILRAARLRATFQLRARLDYLVRVTTLPSAVPNTLVNYERLEYLGDVTLKLLGSLVAFVHHPIAHEGQLTGFRYVMVNNTRLFKYARQARLQNYLTDTAFAPRRWRPPGFVSVEQLEKHQAGQVAAHRKVYPNKTLADLIEASLAACYLSEGFEAGIHCIRQLGLPLGGITRWEDFYPTYRRELEACQERLVAARVGLPITMSEVCASLSTTSTPGLASTGDSAALSGPFAGVSVAKAVDHAAVERVLGYRFRDRSLIDQALTHGSAADASSKSDGGSYERLEYIGDALIDFFSVQYLYHRFPQASPQLLTNLRVASVNNNFLAMLCHAAGLHRHVVHFSPSLGQAIAEYVIHRDQLMDNEEDGEEMGVTSSKAAQLAAVGLNGMQVDSGDQTDTLGDTTSMDIDSVEPPPLPTRSGDTTFAPVLLDGPSDQFATGPSLPSMSTEGRFDYWFAVQPPKVLGDVVEALFGAVFMDAQMELAPVEALYNRWLRPAHDRFITPNLVYIHAATKLIKFIHDAGCSKFNIECYVDTTNPAIEQARKTGLGEQAETELEGGGDVRGAGNWAECTIMIHGRPVYSAQNFSFHRARQLAAMRYLAELRRNQDDLVRCCDCQAWESGEVC
ncbi:Dicer-like protein 1 [Tieghemiomyces parasiticus]|uniref:Dicer-like protein 1 n=1 Tax=Tieghemiomyces parasiticus TaxID=78921 RepID=A0A9W8AFQ5_9FUNG|nr:Dicer-like protein 1 [Tieghemiomyces parasiticus]